MFPVLSEKTRERGGRNKQISENEEEIRNLGQNIYPRKKVSKTLSYKKRVYILKVEL